MRYDNIFPDWFKLNKNPDKFLQRLVARTTGPRMLRPQTFRNQSHVSPSGIVVPYLCHEAYIEKCFGNSQEENWTQMSVILSSWHLSWCPVSVFYFQGVLKSAQVCLLEPVMKLTIHAEPEVVSKITQDIFRKRGTIEQVFYFSFVECAAAAPHSTAEGYGLYHINYTLELWARLYNIWETYNY